MSLAFCPECGNSQPAVGVCADGCDAFALVCQKCGGEGWHLTAAPDGSDERREACGCRAGEAWFDAASERDRYDRDPHERAAARARGNDFEATDGRDWT